jgi:D-glycero-alpha-D-manno-heptose-7-phosphate kinase
VRQVVAQAPVRIDFGGGWTDVPPYTVEQGGCVCNLAIAMHARATLADRACGVEVSMENHSARAERASLLQAEGDAALAVAALRRAGLENVRLDIASDFPRGAGLGGSSAAGVAIAAAVAEWRHESASRSELAMRSRALEVDGLGIAGGFQDHYAAAYGGALGLRFGSETEVEQIPLSDRLVAALERQCIIAYTGASRISGATITAVLDAYRDRVPRVVNALSRMRTLAELMIEALKGESVDDLGLLVAEHWEHQRSLHEKIPTPLIDQILELARSHGALGGKALGASGGGCVLIIATAERFTEVRERVSSLARILPCSVTRQGVSAIPIEG